MLIFCFDGTLSSDTSLNCLKKIPGHKEKQQSLSYLHKYYHLVCKIFILEFHFYFSMIQILTLNPFSLREASDQRTTSGRRKESEGRALALAGTAVVFGRGGMWGFDRGTKTRSNSCTLCREERREV